MNVYIQFSMTMHIPQRGLLKHGNFGVFNSDVSGLIFRCKVYLQPNPAFSACTAMVDKLQKKGEIWYICELCGFGYRSVETAERCEEYCDLHGSCSPEIHKQAVSKPTVRVIPLAA
jgi:hypothetical protein